MTEIDKDNAAAVPSVDGSREACYRAAEAASYDGASWPDVMRMVDAALDAHAPSNPPPEGKVASQREDLAGKLTAIRDKFLVATPDKDHTDYAVITRCIAALASPTEQASDVSGLVEALRPFAEAADEGDRVLAEGWSSDVMPAGRITITDLRRAREALSQAQQVKP